MASELAKITFVLALAWHLRYAKNLRTLKARATTLAPRSWPSRPGFATITLMRLFMFLSFQEFRLLKKSP